MNYEGYIEYKDEVYTFVYKDDFLTLINSNYDIFKNPFSICEKIEFLEGITVNGIQIVFYIDGKANLWCNTIRCFPKMVFIFQKKGSNLIKEKYDAIKFSGGIINRFYSNSKILDNDMLDFYKNKKLEFKDPNKTKSEENVIINNKKAVFQVSVSTPGWKYDGNIKINSINSTLRLKFIKSKQFISFVEDILSINNLLYFCLNRRSISYESIFLEKYNKETNTLENFVKVYMPTRNKDYDQKYMITYNDIKGNVNKLLKLLENVKYSTYIIPENNKEFSSISSITYASMFSAYQSIFNYINEKERIVYDVEEDEFIQIKKEICSQIEIIENKYKNVSSRKRKFVNQFLTLVMKSQLNLEHIILQKIDENKFIVETLHSELKKEIKEKMIFDVVATAVNDRDKITHNDIVDLSNCDIAVYLIIERLIYVMILKRIGLKNKSIESLIIHLSSVNII